MKVRSDLRHELPRIGNLERRVMLLGAAAALFLSGCTNNTQQASNTNAPQRERLSVDEVQATFVGKRWRGPNGTFLFSEDGTYTYTEFGKTETRGPWTYEVKEDGELASDYTSYIFYKVGERYEYFHTRSSKYYPAKPT